MTEKEKIDQIKEEVRSKIKKSIWPPEQKGGQSCGVMPHAIRLTSDEMEVEVTIGTSHSQMKNYDYAMTIMNIIIDDYIK